MSQAWEEVTANRSSFKCPISLFSDHGWETVKPANQILLKWIIGNGVLLDTTHKKARGFITKEYIFETLKIGII